MRKRVQNNFFSLEKAKSKSKSMSMVRTSDGRVTRDMREILQEQARFYENLYTKDPQVNFNLENTSNKKLDITQRILLESDLQQIEIAEAIKSMPRNKCPGPDGIPADFYKIFYSRIKDTLLEVLCHAKKLGRLHNTARYGVISLIPKHNKDRSYLAHWRPIVLLNVDFKILSKIFANRLKLVLDDLIDPLQAGFIKNRQISDNIRRLFDLMELTWAAQMPAIIISVDFHKAFDRVDYTALYKILHLLQSLKANSRQASSISSRIL